MENEKWKMENGKWKMENGRCKMEGGRWKMEDGRWKMEDGRWSVWCRWGDIRFFLKEGSWLGGTSGDKTFYVFLEVTC